MLTDFSFCSDYLDASGTHISESSVNSFKGNIAFGSVHAMDFKTPSRRDDLISLTYLLIYMVQGNLSIIDNVTQLSQSDSFNKILNAKKEASPESLCQSERAAPFYPFIKEVHSLSF